MKTLKIAVVAVFLSGCSTQESNRETLMNQIEKQVQLPRGARSLGEYTRYYADNDDGEVVGVYLIPINDEIRPGERCEELLENFTFREFPCEPMQQPDWTMPAGERRWLKSEQDLPFIADGGCGQVTVIFDKAKSVVKNTHCNGQA